MFVFIENDRKLICCYLYKKEEIINNDKVLQLVNILDRLKLVAFDSFNNPLTAFSSYVYLLSYLPYIGQLCAERNDRNQLWNIVNGVDIATIVINVVVIGSQIELIRILH